MKRGLAAVFALVTLGAVGMVLPEMLAGAADPHPLQESCVGTAIVDLTPSNFGSHPEIASVAFTDSPEDADTDKETATVTTNSGWWITVIQLKTGGGSAHEPAKTFSPAVTSASDSTASGQDVSHVDVCVTTQQTQPTTTTSSPTTTTTVPPTTTTTVPPTTTTTIGGTQVGGIVEEPEPGAQVLGVTEVPEPAPAPQPAAAAEPTEAQPRFTG